MSTSLKDQVLPFGIKADDISFKITASQGVARTEITVAWPGIPFTGFVSLVAEVSESFPIAMTALAMQDEETIKLLVRGVIKGDTDFQKFEACLILVRRVFSAVRASHSKILDLPLTQSPHDAEMLRLEHIAMRGGVSELKGCGVTSVFAQA
jgi:hypothetical protein